MTLNEMIYHRKSCRSFIGKPVDAEMIEKILLHRKLHDLSKEIDYEYRKILAILFLPIAILVELLKMTK